MRYVRFFHTASLNPGVWALLVKYPVSHSLGSPEPGGAAVLGSNAALEFSIAVMEAGRVLIVADSHG